MTPRIPDGRSLVAVGEDDGLPAKALLCTRLHRNVTQQMIACYVATAAIGTPDTDTEMFAEVCVRTAARLQAGSAGRAHTWTFAASRFFFKRMATLFILGYWRRSCRHRALYPKPDSCFSSANSGGPLSAISWMLR